MIDLRQGDCLELMKQIPNKSIDMILCDLPYVISSLEWNIQIPFDLLWLEYNRIIKDNGAIVLFGAEPFSSKLRLSNLKMYKYDWIWIKDKGSDPLNSKIRPLNNIENVMVFYRKAPTYNPQMVAGKPYNHKKSYSFGAMLHDRTIKPIGTISNGQRYPKRDLYFPRDTIRGVSLHPTQKPVKLLEYLIKTYTNEGDTILDNCMGSGSTGVACLNTNRNFIGIELNENYFNIAKARIENNKV